MSLNFLILFLGLLGAAVAMEKVTTSGCGTSKQCVGYPKACVSSGDMCESLITWKTVTHNGKKFLEVELMSYIQSTTNPQYIAVAYSKDAMMPDNPYEACYSSLSGSKPVVAFGYINDKTAPPMNPTPPSADFISMPESMVSVKSNTVMTSCRYKRLLDVPDAKYKLEIGSSYHVLGATGVMANTVLFAKHMRAYESAKVEIKDTSAGGKATPNQLLMLLGSLLLITRMSF